MNGRRVAITGASSGIGEATALALAREGAVVSLAARRKDRIDALAEKIEASGGSAHSFGADLTQEEEAKSFVSEAAEAMGGLDVLVNNAGVMLLGPIEGTDTGEWRRMIEINLLGLLYCTQAALPLMREGGGGHIVNVSSVAGRVASMGTAVYNMTKWGVTGFSEALRQEAQHSKVKVTCLEPGFVDTELQGHNENPAVVKAIEKNRGQIGDVLQAEDMAEAILYALRQPPRVNVNEILVRPLGQPR